MTNIQEAIRKLHSLLTNRKVPLRLVLVVPFVLQIGAAVGLTGWLSFRNGQEAVEELAAQLAGSVGDRIDQHLKNYLSTPHLINKINLDAVNLGLLDLEDLPTLERHFWQQIQLFDSACLIAGANDKGFSVAVERLADGELQIDVVDKSNPDRLHLYATNERGERTALKQAIPNFNPRTRPGYVAAIVAGKPTWSEIFIEGGIPRMAVSAVLPVTDSAGKVRGVFATNLLLSSVSEFLQSLKVGRSGRTFILDRSGKLVASSSLERPFLIENGTPQQIEAAYSSDRQLRAGVRYLQQRFGKKLDIRRSRQLDFSIDGDRHFLHVTPFQDSRGLDWLIVTLVPEAEFMQQINANTYTTIGLCLGALVVAIAIGIATSGWIARPILRLSEAAWAIACGEFDQTLKIKGIYELEVLAYSFQQMARDLQIAFTTWENSHEELETQLQEGTTALRVSEKKFAKAFRCCPDPIAIATLAEGKIVEANDSFLKITGYAKEEAIGHTEVELNIWAQAADRDAMLQMLRETGTFRDRQFNFRIKSGEIRTMLFSAETIDLNGEECVLYVAKDITERQRTLEALLQREEQYRSLYNNTPVMLYSTDSNFRLVSVSDYWLECMGYARDEVLGRPVTDFLTEESRLYALEVAIPNFIKTGNAKHVPYQALKKNGEVVDILLSEIAERNSAGELIRTLAVAIDITDRKRAEEEIQLLLATTQAINEARDFQTALGVALRHICEATGWHYGEAWIPTADGTALECSPTWYYKRQGIPAMAIAPLLQFREYSEGLILLSGEELPGRVWHREQPEWIADVFSQKNDIFLRNKLAKECGLKACLGVPILVAKEDRDKNDKNIPPKCDLKNSNMTVLAALVFFMFESRQQDRRLVKLVSAVANQLGTAMQQKQASAELRALFAAMSDTIVVLDAQGCYLKIAPTQQYFLSKPTSELIGKTLHDVFDRGQADIFMKQIWESLNNQKTIEFEYSLIVAQKEICFVSSISPVSDESVIWISRDITARKRAEEALQKAVSAADAANRAKSQFLANMSHELRTPLNAILGFTQVMMRDSYPGTKHQENLQIISSSGEHLLGLINDILELSKIEAGRIELHEHSFDLHLLIYSLKEMLASGAKAKGLQLIFELAPEVPQYVKADEHKLRQVLINLLGNAIKFTESGRVTLRVSGDGPYALRAGFAYGRLRRGMGNLLFEIEDTGSGIAAEEMGQLFEAFVQTETGRKSQEGTGLGLPISQEFVQLMGGNITATSTLGQGTIFRFNIPIALAERDDIPTKGETDRVLALAPDQPQYRILVVEDRPESRVLLVNLLVSVGFQVREAANGREAIALWESWEPHLIWMDMRMPVMDGYEATKYIKGHLKGQATTIIALTASALETDRAVVLSAGCDDFARKPFREAVIFEKMAQHLGVRYLYEESSQARATGQESQGGHRSDLLLAEGLTAMPAEWIAELNRAARSGDDEIIEDLISQIPEQYAPLAAVLTNLVNNFQFEQLAQLTQAKQ